MLDDERPDHLLTSLLYSPTPILSPTTQRTTNQDAHSSTPPRPDVTDHRLGSRGPRRISPERRGDR